MCQHRVVSSTDGIDTEYFYGFDRQENEYFLVKTLEEEGSTLVGYGGERPGTHGHMLEALESYGLVDLIPPKHFSAIGLDLPCCND